MGAIVVPIASLTSLLMASPALAYNGPAAASYADTWANGRNSSYPFFSQDCTNFVSQALSAGGLPQIVDPSNTSTSNDNYWFILRGKYYLQYSHSWSLALDSYLFQQNVYGIYEGSFSYANGRNRAPAFTPNSVVTGDVLYYDWGQGQGISHASMQVGWGTDSHGYYGNWVDSHTNSERHMFWTLKDAPGNTDWMTTTVIWEHIS